MEAYRPLKSGGNKPLKEGKMGFIGKKRGVSPGRALFTVRRNWVSSKGIPLPSPLIIKIP